MAIKRGAKIFLNEFIFSPNTAEEINISDKYVFSICIHFRSNTSIYLDFRGHLIYHA